jgi:hypothetical protein
MAKEQEVVVLSRDERLRDSKRQATSMALPLAVHHRLDLLAEAAEDAGATRAEIVGMLIAGAGLDTDELELDVLRYRKLRVGDVLPKEQPEPGRYEDREDAGNVISIARRGPGRPSRHGPA